MSGQGEYREPSRPSNEGCSFGVLKWDPTYVRDQWDGRIKLAEIILTLLAGACVPGLYGAYGVFGFFDFVVWMSFLNAFIDMVLHLSSLWGRLMYVCRAPEVYTVLCCIASVSFLLSSALVAGYSHYSSNPTAACVAAFFGFVCMVLFAFEAYFIHYAAFHRGRRESVKQDQEADEFAEPL